MNKELAMEWAEALESGRYFQCKRRLRKEGVGGAMHCCLGVLSEMCKSKVPDPALVEKNLTLDTILPNQVRNFAVMLNAYGTFRSKYSEVHKRVGELLKENDLHDVAVMVTRNSAERISLSGLNDCGVPFTVIAKIIREFWEEL